MKVGNTTWLFSAKLCPVGLKQSLSCSHDPQEDRTGLEPSVPARLVFLQVEMSNTYGTHILVLGSVPNKVASDCTITLFPSHAPQRWLRCRYIRCSPSDFEMLRAALRRLASATL